jgi:RNA polymerase sigma-70 factor (ECF subfamily)
MKKAWSGGRIVTDDFVSPDGEPDDSTSMGLLRGLRSNDRAAWERMVRLYTPVVEYWCQHHGLAGNDVEDVCQEVFLAVDRGIGEFNRIGTGSFRAWLRTVARNKVIDHRRARRGAGLPVGGGEAFEELSMVPDGATPVGEDEATLSEELRILYRRAVELLSGEYDGRSWQVFWRVVVEEHYPADVARDFGIPVGAVYTIKSRILARLRREFKGLLES